MKKSECEMTSEACGMEKMLLLLDPCFFSGYWLPSPVFDFVVDAVA